MKLLVICGATATGKTALAVECAKRLNGEIVSADALLVYRGLNIGTAKPTLQERGGIAHHMIDVVDATANFSVCDFEARALPLIDEIASRGKTPILCGGTGFYINAVLYQSGFGGTGKDEAVRAKYEKLALEEGKDALHRRLEEVDPESANKLHVSDVKRVVRALEIYEVTGRKKSDQHDEKIPRYPFSAFAFSYPREELYQRIERRVDEMIGAGLIGEVEGLLESGVPETAQCMQGIGYKEVIEILKKRDLHSNMSDIVLEISQKIKQNTRNYAKRQLTFFKRMENLTWLEPKELRLAAQEVCDIYEGNGSR